MRRSKAISAADNDPVTPVFTSFQSIFSSAVGHQYRRALFGKEAADPRAVRARFQRDGGAGKLGEQLGQGGAGVG